MKTEEIKLKQKATKISIFSNLSLICLKFVAGILSGSISIISEAMHSGTDLIASFIAYFAVKESCKPADDDHQFGHGKYEYFASLFESLLIILAGFIIAKEAIMKFYHNSNYAINTDFGLIVMGISIVTNFFVSRYLFKVAKKTNSAAILADGSHLSADMFSSIAVILGLMMVRITHNAVFDSSVAIIVSLFIIFSGIKIFKTAQENLLDTSLKVSQIEKIKSILNNFSQVDIKSLKTRNNGIKKNIEIILLIDGDMSVNAAHKLCDEIENALDAELNETEISIHLEPKNINQSELVKNI